MAALLVLVLAAVALLSMYAPARPAPVRVRRNPLQEDLLARYSTIDR